MNIQIFGTKKCFETKKAQRYFKEHGIKFQFIDLKEKPLSKREFLSIKNSVGGLDNMINFSAKDQDVLSLIKYIVDEQKENKVFENQQLLSTPIVRNGSDATVGYKPEIWKTWR